MLHRILQILCVNCALLLCALGAGAQEPATLVADRLVIQSATVLVASGNVEIFFEGQRLRANRITYDQSTDRLLIEGPLFLRDNNGNYISAQNADLKADLTQGVLLSARLVLAGQLQLAATQIMRLDNTTTLTRVTASSCKVCPNNPIPLWEIRARRVIHDQTAQQLYFDQAQMRVAGVPVFYIPRLRMPDPTLKRASGFLMPKFSGTSLLGTGIKQPYFITLGQHADLTVTPFLTTTGGRSVELRFRQSFANGEIKVLGSMARDAVVPGKTRGFTQTTGSFELPRDFTMSFRVETVSDPAFLLDYGYPDKDRLDSRIEVERTKRNENISLRLIGFESLRAEEDNNTLASLVADATFHRRFALGEFGGEGGLRFQLHAHQRRSQSPFDGPDLDLIADGRDVARANIGLDWRKNWVLNNGIIASVLGEARADLFSIRQDADYTAIGPTNDTSVQTRLTSAVAAELRWPWTKTSAAGVAQVIEPVAQVVFSPGASSGIPNEDSVLTEFDEGNLFALSRFAGADAAEGGTRANIGLNYTRIDPAGVNYGVTLGRVIRLDDTDQFTQASGLSGQKSDWLAGLQIENDHGLSLIARALFADDLGLNKSEIKLAWQQPKSSFSSGFVYLPADANEERPDSISELNLDASVVMAENWTARLATRYDFQAERTARAAIGIGFKNECLAMDLSLSRRFTSSTSVQPATDFGISIEFLGFGGASGAGPARQCRR
jgi:LPS-assembly protein